jgi:cobalt-zinc-cadmium efflux system protein
MHSHNHDHNQTQNLQGMRRRMFTTLALNIVIAISQIIGGVISGSLSLISDSFHNLSDAVSLLLSYFALKLKLRNHSHKHTFGFKRAEILAAFINSAVLVGVAIYLFYEAIVRFINPQSIEPGVMGIVAVIGLIGNVIGTILLSKDSKNSMNIRSAYLHLLSDTISSVAIVVGAILIYYWQIYWVDPLLTILIGLYILKECYNIISDSIHILMEGTPAGISLEEIRNAVMEVKDVIDIHHVHVWTVGENDIHLEAHLNICDMPVSKSAVIYDSIEKTLKEKFDIRHITLQFECEKCKGIGLIKETTH